MDKLKATEASVASEVVTLTVASEATPTPMVVTLMVDTLTVAALTVTSVLKQSAQEHLPPVSLEATAMALLTRPADMARAPVAYGLKVNHALMVVLELHPSIVPSRQRAKSPRSPSLRSTYITQVLQTSSINLA